MENEIRLAAAPVTVLDTGEFEAVVSYVDRRDRKGVLIRSGAMQARDNLQVSGFQHSSVPSAIDATPGEPRDQPPVAAAAVYQDGDRLVARGQFFLGADAQAVRQRLRKQLAKGKPPELSLTYQSLREQRVSAGADIAAARPLELTFAKSGIMPGTHITRLNAQEGNMPKPETTTETPPEAAPEAPETPAAQQVDLNINLNAATAEGPAATEEAPAAEAPTEEAPAAEQEESLESMQSRYTTLGETLRKVQEQSDKGQDFSKVKDTALRTARAVQQAFNEFSLLGDAIKERQALNKGLVSLNAETLVNPAGGNGGSPAEPENDGGLDEAAGTIRLRAYDQEIDDLVEKAMATSTGVELPWGLHDIIAHPGHFKQEDGSVRLRATALANIPISTQAAGHQPLFRSPELNLPTYTPTSQPNWDIFRGSLPTAAPAALTNAGDVSVADDGVSSTATAATLLPVIGQDTIPSIANLDAAGRQFQIELLSREVRRKLSHFMFAALAGSSLTAVDRTGADDTNLAAFLRAKTALEDADAEVTAAVMRSAVFSRFRNDAAASTGNPGIYYGMVNDNPRAIDTAPVVTSGRVTAGSGNTERIAYVGEFPLLRFIGRRTTRFEVIRDRLVEGVTIRLTGYYLFYAEQTDGFRQVTGLYQGAADYA